MIDKESNGPEGPISEPINDQSFITMVFGQLESLEADRALKIPLSDLPNPVSETITLLRSEALKTGRPLRLRTDRDFVYIWNAPSEAATEKLEQ